MANQWEEAVRAVYAETYLATLTLTMSTAAAQEDALAQIAKRIEAAVDEAAAGEHDTFSQVHASALAAFEEARRG